MNAPDSYFSTVAKVMRDASQQINARSPSYIERLQQQITDVIYAIEGLPNDDESRLSDCIESLKEAQILLGNWRAPDRGDARDTGARSCTYGQWRE